MPAKDVDFARIQIKYPLNSQYDRWTIIGPFKRINKIMFVLCRCLCGTERFVRVYILGKTSTSCGCKTKKHGFSTTRLYDTWCGIRERCFSPSCKNYKHYGGRGILFYKPWENFMTFREWAISHGYEDGLSIDRVDINGNYCPENREWVTRSENSKRQRQSRILELASLKRENFELKQEIEKLKLQLSQKELALV